MITNKNKLNVVIIHIHREADVREFLCKRAHYVLYRRELIKAKRSSEEAKLGDNPSY